MIISREHARELDRRRRILLLESEFDLLTELGDLADEIHTRHLRIRQARAMLADVRTVLARLEAAA